MIRAAPARDMPPTQCAREEPTSLHRDYSAPVAQIRGRRYAVRQKSPAKNGWTVASPPEKARRAFKSFGYAAGVGKTFSMLSEAAASAQPRRART